MGDDRAPVMLTRRRLSALAIGGAFAGATWTTGMAMLARGWRPRVSVLGDDEWQVLLFEHGRNRMLVLSGAFQESPEPAVNLLCGVLRQRIDVVAGADDALALLPSGFRHRRAVSTFVRFDPPAGTVVSPAYIGLTEATTIRLGAMVVTLEPSISKAWSSSLPANPGWFGHLRIGSHAIAFGPSLGDVAERGEPSATLGIAPAGDARRPWRTLPGIMVVTNARESHPALRDGFHDGIPARLVRTFPRDISLFEVNGQRLSIPDWHEPGGDDMGAS